MYRTVATIAVAILLGACREPIAPPDSMGGAEVALDSAAMMRLAALTPPRPTGLLLAPVSTDPLLIPVGTDSVQVQLLSRDCAAPTNEVYMMSPGTGLLSTDMCEVAEETIWSFLGPYAADSEIQFEFVSGAFGGIVDGQSRVSGAFPAWTLEFEDSFDSDFDDFVLLVTVFGDSQPFVDIRATADELHPAIGQENAAVAGEEATISLTAIGAGWIPLQGETVSFAAEFRTGTGGHAHITTRHSFTEFPDLEFPEHVDLDDLPAVGHFRHGATTADSISVLTTAEGVAAVQFVAGFLSGTVEIIVRAVIDSVAVADTISIDIRVPGLVDVEDEISNVYFIGGVPSFHEQGTNWYVRPDLVPRLQRLADLGESMVGITPVYLQFNDASLEWGGAITAGTAGADTIDSSDMLVDNPFRGHVSHAFGADIDVAACYAKYVGDDNQIHRVRNADCKEVDNSNIPNPALLISRQRFWVNARDAGAMMPPFSIDENDHYHLRFAEVP